MEGPILPPEIIFRIIKWAPFEAFRGLLFSCWACYHECRRVLPEKVGQWVKITKSGLTTAETLPNGVVHGVMWENNDSSYHLFGKPLIIAKYIEHSGNTGIAFYLNDIKFIYRYKNDILYLLRIVTCEWTIHICSSDERNDYMIKYKPEEIRKIYHLLNWFNFVDIDKHVEKYQITIHNDILKIDIYNDTHNSRVISISIGGETIKNIDFYKKSGPDQNIINFVYANVKSDKRIFPLLEKFVGPKKEEEPKIYFISKIEDKVVRFARPGPM